MSQTSVTVSERKLWVLVSSVKDDTKEIDLQMVTPSIIDLVNEWHSKGNFMWSGSLDDNKTGMAIFEATHEEAREVYDRYDKICSGILNYHLYEWNAMPFLLAL